MKTWLLNLVPSKARWIWFLIWIGTNDPQAEEELLLIIIVEVVVVIIMIVCSVPNILQYSGVILTAWIWKAKCLSLNPRSTSNELMTLASYWISQCLHFLIRKTEDSYNIDAMWLLWGTNKTWKALRICIRTLSCLHHTVSFMQKGNIFIHHYIHIA